MPYHIRNYGDCAFRTAVTLAVSVAGGYLATLAGMPAAWISGGMLAVAVVSLAGMNTEVPAPLRAPSFVLIGIYSGSGVSPETLHQMQTWPGSFAILAISVIAMTALSYWWLHARSGWDRNTALLASLPGALTFVIAAAEDLRADMKKVALSQSIRVLALVELIPLLAFFTRHQQMPAESAQFQAVRPFELALLLVTGALAGFLLERLKLPGGWMLGGLLTSAALLLSGVVTAGLPFYLVLPAMIGVGAIAGSRFRPGDLALLPALARPALVAFFIAMGVSGISAGLVTLLFGISFLQALLAFAPGALEVLTIIATEMNLDPAYVAAHHVARFLALVLAVPVLAHWLSRGGRDERRS